MGCDQYSNKDEEHVMDLEDTQSFQASSQTLKRKRLIEKSDADEGFQELFKKCKKKKNEKDPNEIAFLVENIMAELEVSAEEDAELNRQGKPAINKLNKLPLLIHFLSKKHLQQEFLDHGVLTLLKTWLDPLPDGSLPNIDTRTAVFKILNDLPIDLQRCHTRQQLNKSGLGKVIMFFSRSSEETNVNKKLAKDLVDKWSRSIFNKSSTFKDVTDHRAPLLRPCVEKPSNKTRKIELTDGDLDLEIDLHRRRSEQPSSKQHTSRPEATLLDFVIRPQSKIDPEQVRARVKQSAAQNQHLMRMNKKMNQFRAQNKRKLQAFKLSVQGRDMFKYL